MENNKKLSKFSDICMTLIIIMFIVCFGIALFEAIAFNKNILGFNYTPILMIIAAAVFVVLLILIYKKLIPKIKNNLKVPIAIIILMFIIQLICSYFLLTNPAWDIKAAFNEACYINESTYSGYGYDINDTTIKEYSYTDMFPNNVFLVFIFSVIIKICNIFGFSNYVVAITIFNTIAINLAIVLMYLLARKLFGDKKALMALIIAFITLPFYLYGPIYYTDSLSLIFPIAILYFYLLSRDENKKIRKVIWQILLGLFIFAAIKMKLTASFMVIAIVMFELLRKNFKVLIKNLALPVVITLVTSVIFTNLLTRADIINEDRSYSIKIPYQHWILMSLKGNAGYDVEEYKLTNEAGNYDQKVESINARLKERLKEYGFSGVAKQLLKKITITWGDGNYYVTEQLRAGRIRDIDIYEFLLPNGKYSSYYKYIPQGLHLSLLVFCLIAAFRAIKEKELDKDKMMLLIMILGVFVFLLLWETCSRYIFNIVPILILVSIDGIDYISFGKKEKEKLKLKEGKEEI